MPALIAMILAGSLIYLVTELIKPGEVRPAGGSATPANDLILAGEQMQLAIRQAELSQREVLLDAAPERLRTWTLARSDIVRRVELLRQFSSDNQPQADGLQQLEDLTFQWLDSLDVAVEEAFGAGADNARLPQHLRESAQLAQHLEEVLRAVVVAEERRYGISSATQAAADQQRAHQQYMIAAIGFGFIVLFAGAIGTFAALSVRAKRERLLAAERLRGEERLRRLVEALPQLVWICDAEGVCTDSSPQWAVYTGRTEASQTGDGWIEAIHPDDRQRLLTVWQHSIDTQEPYDTEARVRGADGVYRWFKKRAVAIRGDDGRVETWIGTSTDISDVRLAQQALHDREAMLRRFIDAAPVAIAMFDRNMCYLGASRRFITDFDIDDDGLIGRSHYEVLPQNPPHWRAIHQRCLCGAVERSPGERFVRPDGTAIWLRWELQPWYDAEGLIGGVTLFTEDISQRKQTEDTLFREMLSAPRSPCIRSGMR
ncbi:PAS domain S-box protein [Defluviicoccus vanus]|nr:PAS domain S-box protein [Defluviicoccus vanus]